MSELTIESPTRVDFVGGTLDCWPLYCLFPQTVTINLGVGLFTKVELCKVAKEAFILKNNDVGRVLELDSCGSAKLDPDFAILQLHLQYWNVSAGIEVTTSSEVPRGSGLGASSSLNVSLAKLFNTYLKAGKSDAELLGVVRDIETQIMGKPAGVQDYYPAFKGGVNVLRFNFGGPRWTIADTFWHEFNSQLILVDSGRSHHSGMNNWTIIKNAMEGDAKTLERLSDLEKNSVEAFEQLEKNQWQGFMECVAKEHGLRQKLSPEFTSPEIESIIGSVRKVDPSVVAKVCGAGGGGCVALFAQPDRHEIIKNELRSLDFATLPVKPFFNENA